MKIVLLIAPVALTLAACASQTRPDAAQLVDKEGKPCAEGSVRAPLPLIGPDAIGGCRTRLDWKNARQIQDEKSRMAERNRSWQASMPSGAAAE